MQDIDFICIDNLLKYSSILNGESVSSDLPDRAFIYYVTSPSEMFLLDKNKVNLRTKVESLSIPTCLFDMIHLMTISGKYIPIYDKDTNELLFSEREYNDQRKKISGIERYNAGDFVLSDNLYFEGLEPYLKKIDENNEIVSERRTSILGYLKKVIESIGLTFSFGFNSGGDVEFIETGSTSRGTNIPQTNSDMKWDFDFTVRFSAENESEMWTKFGKIKSALRGLDGNLLEGNANDKVRLIDVKIPGLDAPVDLDFSINGQKKDYVSTDDALKDKLENIRKQDEAKYRLVLANIMFAKDYLKTSGAYKPNRSLSYEERKNGNGCIGGIGIENWILQNGGSLIDAMNEFLSYASLDKDFIDFEKEYAIMDFGQDHVSVSKRRFPHHNFIMRNMRENGYRKMINALVELKNKLGLDSLENEKNCIK